MRIIVTGATGGIGRAICEKFASVGAKLIVVARTESQIIELKKHLKQFDCDVEGITGDITSVSTCEGIINLSDKLYNGVDCLVNCAGIIHRALTLNYTLSDWERVLNVNLQSAFVLSKLVISEMIHNKNGGNIVNIASQMADIPHLGASPSYESSKAGLLALTRHLAAEFADKNIRVNAVSPGSIETEMNKNMPKDKWDNILSKIPMKRLGQPSEVADVVHFLCSPKASYVTGTNIYVAGGSIMN